MIKNNDKQKSMLRKKKVNVNIEIESKKKLKIKNKLNSWKYSDKILGTKKVYIYLLKLFCNVIDIGITNNNIFSFKKKE